MTYPAPPLPGSVQEPEVLHLCRRCGRVHAWSSLPQLGIESYGTGDFTELKNCPCGDTLAESVKGP